MKEFSHFIEKQEVKKQNPDNNLSQATFKASIERLHHAQKLAKEKDNPKYVLENAYEAMREASDSILYAEGDKSYSQEASIVYLENKEFNQQELTEFNRFRKIRNNIKYYGQTCDEIDAQLCLKLAQHIINKIEKILKK